MVDYFHLMMMRLVVLVLTEKIDEVQEAQNLVVGIPEKLLYIDVEMEDMDCIACY